MQISMRKRRADPYFRAAAYKILGSLYEYPGDSFLKKIDQEIQKIRNIFFELKKADPFKDIPTLEDPFIHIKDLPLEEIQAEYVNLFEYIPLCPPYETSYISVEPMEVIISLMDCYKKFGLDMAQPYPPDYLMFELEFMQYLIQKEEISWQKKFLQEHLTVWIPDFCECLRKNAHLPFYQSIASLTDHFISLDLKYVLSLLSNNSIKKQRR